LTLNDGSILKAIGAFFQVSNLRAITLTGSVTISSSIPSGLHIDGVINGSGSLTVSGSLYLTGANTYTGGTIVSAGSVLELVGPAQGSELGTGPIASTMASIFFIILSTTTNNPIPLDNAITVNGTSTIVRRWCRDSGRNN